jgi:serine protease Do
VVWRVDRLQRTARSEEADMTEAPAQTTSAVQPAVNASPPAARSAPSRGGAIAVLTAALFIGASLFSKPVLVSQAQITMKPAGFADVVDKVKPAVVSVQVKTDTGRRNREQARSRDRDLPDRFSRRFGEQDQPGARSSSRDRGVVTGQGSGFFVSPDGYAVTNFHVVEKADVVEVSLDDGRALPAKVIGADKRSDIALIKVDGSGLPFVTFADTIPRIGDWVIAVGNPFGLGGTVTAGIVSAHGRDIGAGPYDDFIQIDAAVNRGNSGGPTFDTDGNVVGVNTAIVSPTGGSVGIAFAIPSATVKAIVSQLKDTGKVSRGWIGVQIQEVTADIAEGLGLNGTRGALVADPQPGSPAAKGGIESGDVIVSINGTDAHDSREVARTISNLPPGSTASIAVVRRGEEKSFNIVLGNLPEQREANVSTEQPPRQKGTSVPRVGVAVAPASEGVVVTSVDPDGPAADQGLASGDVILQAEGKKVAGVSDLRNTIEAAQKAGRHVVLMRVKSSDGIKFVAVPFNRG